MGPVREAEVDVVMVAEDGDPVVVLLLGEPTDTALLTPAKARTLADALMEQADAADQAARQRREVE